MNKLVNELFEQARRLPASEREALADLLLDSLEPEADVETAWRDEAERRWRDHIANGETTHEAFATRDEARRLIKRSH
jgi:putative addiction module component (TIGR02574 family)